MEEKDTLLTFDDSVIVDSFALDDKIIAVIDLDEMNEGNTGCYAFGELAKENGEYFIKALDDKLYSKAVEEYKIMIELFN